jgi:AAA domain
MHGVFPNLGEAKASAEKENATPDDPPGTITCDGVFPLGATKIPPRRWAYGSFLLLGTAAVLGAVDGGGKGAIAVVMALAIITGKPLLGERVWRKGPVAIVTYEDDETEWHRRIAAACLHYKLDYEDALRNFHFLSKPGDRVSFATVKDSNVTFPDGDEIVRHLKNIGAVLLIIDPFNHAHELDDGNNNVMVAKVAAEVSRIVREAPAAGLVLHHLRKSSSGAPDDLMGATSLRATFRSARILSRMTPDIAEKMKITDPWRYIRVAGSKENYAPPPEKATWFKLISVRLENVTDEYPDGDDVAVATTWQPRPLFEGMDAATLRAVFDALRQTVHGPNRQARHTPWAGLPLIGSGRRSEREAAQIIKAWIGSGVLVTQKYYHLPSKHEVEKVVLDEAKGADILSELEFFSAPSE